MAGEFEFEIKIGLISILSLNDTWYGCYSTIADLVEMESVIQIIIFGLLQKRVDFGTNYKFNNKNNFLPTWRDFKIPLLVI